MGIAPFAAERLVQAITTREHEANARAARAPVGAGVVLQRERRLTDRRREAGRSAAPRPPEHGDVTILRAVAASAARYRAWRVRVSGSTQILIYGSSPNCHQPEVQSAR
jgi:hypothetical protein